MAFKCTRWRIAMVNVGFIGEGKTETMILNSESFLLFLKKVNIEIVGVFDAGGEGNLKVESKKIISFFEILSDRNADFVFLLTDLEEDPCITETKTKILKFSKKQQIEIIAVKTIESWFLADSESLSEIFKRRYHFENPENIEGKPFDLIRDEFVKNTGRGISKDRLARKMLNHGFSVENAAKHDNCNSAKYFINKLKEISNQ
ncbi:MAG: hypothetical protein JEY97_01255 [Bacteroidales bacterium]|nr:hypothetical protein [Bacteroidales bacterium]